MAELPNYEPRYGQSWALVVGIDKYRFASPLDQARSDAEGVARALQETFGFAEERITLLLDEAATREAISAGFLKYVEVSQPNDRIVVFFAGHGHTVTGRRGETGFLVPVDGRAEDIVSLIRWDELTRNADLIPAKHIFFLMDACYGGLALTRKPIPSGSMRFLKDMLQRYSRQVLTAGKADEVVADGGGPRVGHSMFTGHVLDALEGGARTAEGVITATGVMAYVYERVGSDPYSRQTPHYGFLDGDGDFVFDASALSGLGDEGKTDQDVLIKLSAALVAPPEPGESVAETTKDLLSAPAQEIRLDDYVSRHVRRVIDKTRVVEYPVQGVGATKEEFAARLRRYEDAVEDLRVVATLLGRWSQPGHLPQLEKMFARLAEANKESGGTVLWLSLEWYPCLLLMYSAGIAALSADKYDVLAKVLTTLVKPGMRSSSLREPIVVPVVDAMTELERHDAFKWIPGHEKNYAPRSEYLFKQQQPMLEDVLFLGESYEGLFDRFEMFLSLMYGEATGRGWGPPGRFAWKHSRGFGEGPYRELIKEAERAGDAWGPLRAGLFGGSVKEFMEAARAYEERLTKLAWW